MRHHWAVHPPAGKTNMSSSVRSNIQQELREHCEYEEERVKILEHLLEKLKRESLALVRQSEFACELLARIEELEEQVDELTEQEEFLLARLDYWRQRYSDLEESKRDAEGRLRYRISRQSAENMEMLITEGELWGLIRDRDLNIDNLERLLEEKAGIPRTAANNETSEPRSNDDPTPDWLAHNNPEDWYGIALRASRSEESEESPARTSDGDMSEQLSEARFSTGSQFEYRPFNSNGSVPNNLHEREEEEERSDAESDMTESENEEKEIPEDVDSLRAEVERLRLQVRSLKEKEKAHERQKRNLGRLYPDLLQLYSPREPAQGSW